ncbi:MAG: hypothetical protein LBK41_04825, partial [Clostridiales bacterium]|nr:hypothetical protein [Clostridiales bacterium]
GEPIAETLTGTAALSPDKPKIGHTVTAALTDTNNTGTLAYVFKVGGVEVQSSTSDTYVVRPADEGKTITVEVYSSVQTGVVVSAPTAAVASAAVLVQFEEMLDPGSYYHDGTKHENDGSIPLSVYTMYGVDPAMDETHADGTEYWGYLKFEPGTGVTQYSRAFDTGLWDTDEHDALTPGYYKITVSTKYYDNYGRMSFTMDGEPLGGVIDGYLPNVKDTLFGKYGQTVLSESFLITGDAQHEIVMTVNGKNESSSGYQTALDWIMFEKVADLPAPLTGTAQLSPTAPAFGGTLTASLAGGNNTGSLTYTFKADGATVQSGASDSYAVTLADAGKAITVEITSDIQTGVVVSAPTAAVTGFDVAVSFGADAAAAFTVTNYSGSDKTVSLIVAVYAGGRLAATTRQSRTAPSRAVTPYTISAPIPAKYSLSQVMVTAYVWDDSYAPLRPAVTFAQ